VDLAYSVDVKRDMGHASRSQTISLLAGTLDLIVVVMAILLADFLRFGSEDKSVSGLGATDYSLFSVALGFVWVISLVLSGAYRRELFGVGVEEFRSIAWATFWAFGATAMVSLLFKLDIARGYLAIAFPLGLALLLTERALVRHWLVRRRATGQFADRALILGTPVEVRYAADALARNPAAGYRTSLVSVIGHDERTFTLGDGSEVDNVDDITNLAALYGSVDVLIIAGQSAISRKELRRIGWQLEGTNIGLALASSMTDVAGPRIHRRTIEGLPLMSVEAPSYSGTKFIVKRTLDVLLSGTALIVLSPVFLIVALLIYLEDRGPIFFRQVRVGVNGRLFRIWKFRSMSTDAEKRLGEFEGAGLPVWKLKEDPRVTRVGKFIRTYSLDELPQLFDVLIGTMSLVGPRPQQPSEVETYAAHMHRRLNVKPGITGPWQVSGRSNLTWDQTIQKDLYYVENWSVVGDLIIMLKTVRAVLARDGAY